MFIAFEGGEGTGKTTQSGILVDKLRALSRPCELVREPGDTVLGEYLREYLKSERPLTPEAELLLFEASRVELIVNRIRPSLDSGNTVIADRFSASTIAYQGNGRGIDLGVITALNAFATQGISPDLMFLLDMKPADALNRTEGRQMAFTVETTGAPGGLGGLTPLHRTDEGRRFEDLSLEFHEKVRQGFLVQARADPEIWVVIDAARPVPEVGNEVWRQVRQRLESSGQFLQMET